MVREALASQLQATSPLAQAASSSLPSQGLGNTSLSPMTMSLQQQQASSPSLEVCDVIAAYALFATSKSIRVNKYL